MFDFFGRYRGLEVGNAGFEFVGVGFFFGEGFETLFVDFKVGVSFFTEGFDRVQCLGVSM